MKHKAKLPGLLHQKLYQNDIFNCYCVTTTRLKTWSDSGDIGRSQKLHKRKGSIYAYTST